MLSGKSGVTSKKPDFSPRAPKSSWYWDKGLPSILLHQLQYDLGRADVSPQGVRRKQRSGPAFHSQRYGLLIVVVINLIPVPPLDGAKVWILIPLIKRARMRRAKSDVR